MSAKTSRIALGVSLKTFSSVTSSSWCVFWKRGLIACGICSGVCPHLILEMHGPKAAIRNRDECMECGACALNCPVKAITVDAGVGCASGMINRWLAGFNIRFRRDDSCC